jgi:uncharacterized protein (TIGR02246 family)
MLLLSLPAFARDAAPVAANEGTPKVESAIEDWKAAVEGGNAQAIAALYDKNAIMISTFVQLPITKREDLLAYYKKVVANPDVQVKIEETHPRQYGNMAIDTGRYTLSYTQEGEEIAIPARFSFVYQLQNGKWMIVDHHSSRVPLPEK